MTKRTSPPAVQLCFFDPPEEEGKREREGEPGALPFWFAFLPSIVRDLSIPNWDRAGFFCPGGFTHFVLMVDGEVVWEGDISEAIETLILAPVGGGGIDADNGPGV